MKNRAVFCALGFLAALSLFVGSCAGAASPPAVTQVTFTDAEQNEPGTVDPQKLGTGGNFYTSEALDIWSMLDYHLMPCLAKSWEALDAKTWKFTIQPGVKFHNGDTMTSADVQYSFYRGMGKYNPNFVGVRQAVNKALIDSIDAPDDSTVIFHLLRPEVSLPDILHVDRIVPKNYTEKVGDDAFGKAPVGTGPFMFKEWKINESLTLEANPNYWNTSPLPGQLNRPSIETVTYRFIPEEASRIAALQAGEIDAANTISPDNARALEKDPKIKVYYNGINTPNYMIMNWRAEKDGNGNPNPFLDVRVRQAMNYALDIDTLIKNYGTGREYRTTMLGKGGLGYNPNAIIYNYNPDKARQLLKEAGYPNGFATKWNQVQVIPQYEAMQKYWKDIGVDVSFTTMAQPVLVSRVNNKTLDGMTAWSAAQGADPMNQFLENVVKYEGNNAVHGKDPVAEDLAVKARSEVDPQKRAKLYDQIISIIWKDAWFVPLWEPVQIRAFSAKWDYANPPATGYSGIDITSIKLKK
jgi:peptide/nickel transport system substrate-binding protein